MADLIDRTELIALIQKGYCEPCKDEKLDRNGVCCRVCWVNEAISEIDRMPTIDPESLRPAGRWEYHELSDGTRVPKCTNCCLLYLWESPYCPHCGARMEVQDDE